MDPLRDSIDTYGPLLTKMYSNARMKYLDFESIPMYCNILESAI